MSVEIQHDLLGGESRKIHRTAKFESAKAKQLNLFGGLNLNADQMNLFADDGIPDELVWKQALAELYGFGCAPDAIAKGYVKLREMFDGTDSDVLQEFGTEDVAIIKGASIGDGEYEFAIYEKAK